MPSTEVTEEINSPQLEFKNYDWPLISKALIPTLIIAVGAGLTIPFVGIFFYNVHKLTTDRFGILSAFASVLVAIGALYVPLIKKHIGFKIAIPTTQTIAVIALALLATTQFYAHLTIALAIAAICFLVRQPLMNMAGPMTTELVMDYVGKKNQEMVSALTSAIWSGSWFISGLIFKYLRQSGIDYVYVFLITVILYGLGVVWYYYLILDYHKKSIHANTQN
jgi:predicted MFS family arabinose efflux permease